MGDKREYVKLWLSYRSYFEAYSAAEVGRLVLAAMDYRESGAEPEFSGSERFIWPAIRRDIDESVAAQKAISASRSEAGKQGGRPESEKANAFDESNEKQKKQMLSEESKKSYGQRKGTKEKDKDMDSILSPLPPKDIVTEVAAPPYDVHCANPLRNGWHTKGNDGRSISLLACKALLRRSQRLRRNTARKP